MNNIFVKFFKATKNTGSLSGVNSLIAAKIWDVVWRHLDWLSNNDYLCGGSSGGLNWGLICRPKSSKQYFIRYLKSIASLKG